MTAGPLKGLTIQPLIPADLPRSFIAGLFSVVSMMMLTAALFSSPRIFSAMVRPSIFGMFTSLTTNLMPGSAFNFSSPSLPSTAGVTASPLPGPSGNVEYFLWLRADSAGSLGGSLEAAVECAVEEGPQ